MMLWHRLCDLVAACFTFVTQSAARSPAYVYFRCEGCRQKLRMLADRFGRGVMCPRCRHVVSVPAE